jgi:hypothetical protein
VASPPGTDRGVAHLSPKCLPVCHGFIRAAYPAYWGTRPVLVARLRGYRLPTGTQVSVSGM